MKRWTRQHDTLLVAHRMTLDEIGELLGRTEAEMFQRADALGVEIGPAFEPEAAGHGELRLKLHPDLVSELTGAADQAGEPFEAFCRRMLRCGFLAHARSAEVLPELPPSVLNEVLEDCRQGQHAMPRENAEHIARRIILHLCRGSIQAAGDALQSGWQTHLDSLAALPAGEALLSEPLAKALDDTRLLNLLDASGVTTIGQFLKCSDADFLDMPMIGPSGRCQLRNLAVGLRLRVGSQEAA